MARGRPFGDSSYIQGQMHAAFMRRLTDLAVDFPVAGDLRIALNTADHHTRYRVLGDPVVRAAIQQALGHRIDGASVTLSLQECGEVLEAGCDCVRRGVDGPPCLSHLSDARYIGDSTSAPWLWESKQFDDIFTTTFDRLVTTEYTNSLCTPSASDVAVLHKATQLLRELVPLLTQSALDHVHVIGLFSGAGNWARVASSSQFRLTGAIFLNQTTLNNPWWVAEHLLHESLHQKLYDFRHGHSMLARDLAGQLQGLVDSRTIVSLWNTPGLDDSNRWDSHRALAAFHVYVHLALFCSLAEQQAPRLRQAFGPVDASPPMTSGRKAFDRARYLGDRLRSTCMADLGLAGQRLVEWLNSILDALDHRPAPAGAYLHLLLDRYLLEAATVQQRRPSPEIVVQLGALASIEGTTISNLLHGLVPKPEAMEFTAALARHLAPNNADAFTEVRRLIATTLERLARNGDTLRPGSDPSGHTSDEIVTGMIEGASLILAATGVIA